MHDAPSFESQLAAQEVCLAPNAYEAHLLFQQHVDLLRDWQIVYAELSDAGSFRLLNEPLGDKGLITSAYRGRSLWVMDAPFVTGDVNAQVPFQFGTAVFIDSNAASYIRAMAYEAQPKQEVLRAAHWINCLGDRLQHLNPALYLWEAHRHWTPKTVDRCMETVAALDALKRSGGPLSPEWGERFRTSHREEAEAFGKSLVTQFESDLAGGGWASMAEQLDMMEAMLVRTQLIELGSKKSKQHKIAQLVEFMHQDLSTMMLRELIVCADILSRSDTSGLARKLNSLQNKPEPLSLLRACAWDMLIPRLMDLLSPVRPQGYESLDVYVAELLTFDGDVRDVLQTTQLRALAIHRPSHGVYPFFDNEIVKWLETRVGGKRFERLASLFVVEGADARRRQRSIEAIRATLVEDRDRLLTLLGSLNERDVTP